jgi:tRNA(Phe) wybutosine-synthesizing methylase Tyw3
MYVCFNCLTKHDNKICNCRSPELAEIDDNITDVIITLNRKGYVTTDCCSGHISQNVTCVYVYFKKLYEFDFEPNGFDVIKWNDRTLVTFYKRKRNQSDEEIEMILRGKIKILKRWVESL